MLYGDCAGVFWSTSRRVPCASCMPSGTVTRSTFCPPSGSNSCTIATGMPFSRRPSFVMTQTCLLLWRLRGGRLRRLGRLRGGRLLLRRRRFLRGGGLGLLLLGQRGRCEKG